MVLSKKQALIIAATVIAGTGIGFMVLGDTGDDNGGESEQIPESKKDLMIHYEAPVYAPSDIYAPYTETNVTEIIHNIITNVLPPPTPSPTPDPTEKIIWGNLTPPPQEKYYQDPHYTETITHPDGTKEIVLTFDEPTGTPPVKKIPSPPAPAPAPSAPAGFVKREGKAGYYSR